MFNNINKISAAILIVIFSVTCIQAAVSDYDQIKPWLNDETIAVLSIDLERIDTQIICNELKYYIAQYASQDESNQILKTLSSVKCLVDGHLEQFRNDGMKSVSLAIDMNDLPLFYLVVAHKPGSECNAFRGLIQTWNLTGFKNNPFVNLDSMVDAGDVLLVGKSDILTRLQNDTLSDRADVRDAFKAADGAAVKFVITPPDSLRRVLCETFIVPNGDLTITGSNLVSYIRWGAVGLKLSDKIQLSYTVQSENSNKAAAALKDNLNSYISDHAELGKIFPEPLDDLKGLLPQVSGNKLAKSIDKIQIRALLAPLFSECVSEAAVKANTTISLQNIKAIVTGLIIYANDHSDTLPQKLEELIATVDMPAKGLVSPLQEYGTGYIYRGSDLNCSMKDCGKLIALYERWEFHGTTKYIAGFMDGHCELMTNEAFQRALTEDNGLRKIANLVEKPEL